MRKVVRTVGESFTRKTLLPLLLHWSYGGLACRSISTNSAINRGIRRGKTGSSRDDVRSRNENHGRWRDQAQERRPVERHERVRKPNHQQQQDVQDIKASAMMKESRRTPRQKKYLSGGRRDQSLSSRTTQQEFDPDRYNKGRQSFNDYGRGLTKPRSRSNDDRPRISPRSDRMTGREDHASRHQSLEKSDIDPSFRQYRAPTSGDDPVSVTGSQARQQRASKEPLSIPYTTPASEFLYGTSVILAALRSGRRKMYKLYVYDGDNREAAARDASVQKLAGAAGVPVKPVKGDWLRLMDKMSTGRPHNGYILEASPLPKLPVTNFKPVAAPQSSFQTTLGHQSREEEAVNGTDGKISYQGGSHRYPFVLMLDGILDPGNLGAILRTAYFLGVDAVAISTRNSAPFSPVALKASAGASEDVPLLSVSQPGAFIDESKKNGWQFYAAVAPPSGTHARKGGFLSTSTLHSPLTRSPAVLMLGGEGEGLRWNLQRKADHEIGIDGARAGMGGIDSLNVSVATGLLCEAFLRTPDMAAERMSVQGPQNVEERMF